MRPLRHVLIVIVRPGGAPPILIVEPNGARPLAPTGVASPVKRIHGMDGWRWRYADCPLSFMAGRCGQQVPR